MRELIPTIEGALGPERLRRLKRDDDAYQQFWLGVLEALSRVDLSRDSVSFLISNGYGSIRNMRRGENSRNRIRHCPSCGREYGNRTVECPLCRVPTEGAVRVVPTSNSEGCEIDFEDRRGADPDVGVDIGLFLKTLSGRELYVGRRWLQDRADLLYKNHLEQIAFELGISKPRAAQIKMKVKVAFRRWYFGT